MVMEPSAVSRRRALGMRKACTQASVAPVAPKRCAITRSRAMPSSRESRVKKVTVPAWP